MAGELAVALVAVDVRHVLVPTFQRATPVANLSPLRYAAGGATRPAQSDEMYMARRCRRDWRRMDARHLGQ